LTSVLLAIVLGASAHADPAGPDRATTIPLGLYLGQIPSLAVSAAGREVRFLLDTAGGITAVTPQFASDIGCQPWGQITGFRMRGERLDLQRCDDVRLSLAGAGLTVPTAGVWDLAKILPEDAPPLAGSLALDAFAGHAVTLDLAARQLILETAASLRARTAHAVEVPVRFDRSAQGLALTPVVAVETSKGRLWMELDCGSDGALIVGRHAAELLHLDPAARGAQKVAMSLAGGIPVEGKARVENLILDGNIGVPVLRRWTVTLDLAAQRLWIAPRAAEDAKP
jgi:hypothetical protein